ncbi:hypothetical protein ACOMHN_028514 [Nucella lapillus]
MARKLQQSSPSVSLNVVFLLLLILALLRENNAGNASSHLASQMASQSASNRLCGPLGALQSTPVTWGHSVPVGSSPGAMVTPMLNCSDNRRLVALEVRPHAKRHSATDGSDREHSYCHIR